MIAMLPGTTIEANLREKNVSDVILKNIFSAGGLVLSQVSQLTGLEPYTVQNWVKRGFLSSPRKKQYSKNQFCRIVIINMLKESLQIDKITNLLSYINGHLDDESDDRIGDSELYHFFVNLIVSLGAPTSDRAEIRRMIAASIAEYDEKMEGTKKRLEKVLEIMLYAYYASLLRSTAEAALLEL